MEKVNQDYQRCPHMKQKMMSLIVHEAVSIKHITFKHLANQGKQKATKLYNAKVTV